MKIAALLSMFACLRAEADWASLQSWCEENGVVPSEGCVVAEVTVDNTPYYGCNSGCDKDCCGGAIPQATPACSTNMNANRYHAEILAVQSAADHDANAQGGSVDMFVTKPPCGSCVTQASLGNLNKIQTLISAQSVHVHFSTAASHPFVQDNQNGMIVAPRCPAPHHRGFLAKAVRSHRRQLQPFGTEGVPTQPRAGAGL